MRLTASLRWRLLIFLIGLFLVTWLVSFAVSYVASSHRIGALFDTRLAQDAKALLILAEHQLPVAGSGTAAREISIEHPRFRRVLAFVVWRDGRVVLSSENAPNVAPPVQAGYGDTLIEGRSWRQFVILDPQDNIVIWAGERQRVRQKLISSVALDLLVPMLLALPLLAAAVWWGVARAMRPLARMTREIASRSPSNLEPVRSGAVLSEIEPLVDRLDDLLARLREAFERERRFTADAAHEIRTPLATIKTHAQVALRTTDDAQRRRSLEHLIEGVDRAARLVEQLLTLARLDRETLERQFVAVSLDALVAETLAGSRAEADAKGIALRSQVAPGLVVQGNLAALVIMLRNIIDNAVRYAPQNSVIDLVAARDAGETRLAVIDEGPGVPRAEQARLFDRFYRGTGVTAPGSGLGLSIAQRVAELHRGRISVSDGPAGRGLQVVVCLPRSAPSA